MRCKMVLTQQAGRSGRLLLAAATHSTTATRTGGTRPASTSLSRDKKTTTLPGRVPPVRVAVVLWVAAASSSLPDLPACCC